MGATAHGFPYPDPTDRARSGSVAIKALAEACDATTAPRYHGTDLNSAPVDVPVGAFVNLVSVTWTEPPAWVLITGGATVQTDNPANPSTKTLRLLNNGTLLANLNTNSGIVGSSLTRVGHVATGDVLTLTVAGGTLDSNAYDYWLQVIGLGLAES